MTDGAGDDDSNGGWWTAMMGDDGDGNGCRWGRCDKGNDAVEGDGDGGLVDEVDNDNGG